MQYWGKLIGIILGLMSGIGFWGVAIGLLMGHLIDKSRGLNGHHYFVNQQQRQALFFHTTFQVMGHLTKAKGRVTEADIQIASRLMAKMQLHGTARSSAQQAFREGKEADYPLRQKLRELRRVCFGRSDLIRMFLEIQLQAAFADGALHPNERRVLYVIAEELGFSRQEFERCLSRIEGGRQFDSAGYHWGYQQSQQTDGDYQQQPTLEDACKVLGINVRDETTVIKRAYRKLMSEHHPDKLVAKGLPPEMLQMAKQKTQEIQAAYDLIKKEKGFK